MELNNDRFTARLREIEEVMVVNVTNETFGILKEDPENQVAIITRDGRRMIVTARELAA